MNKDSWIATALSAIFVAIVVWASTNVYLYYSNRWKIEAVILMDISAYSQKIGEIQAFCNKYMDSQLKVNSPILRHMKYSKDEFDTYKMLMPEIIKYCSKEHIVKIMKFYNVLCEYDFLMSSICEEFATMQTNKVTLKDDDIVFIKIKKDRISNIVKIITQLKYQSIDDLPDDYRGITPPETLVK